MDGNSKCRGYNKDTSGNKKSTPVYRKRYQLVKTKQVTLAFYASPSVLHATSNILSSTTEDDCVDTIRSFFENTEIDKYLLD